MLLLSYPALLAVRLPKECKSQLSQMYYQARIAGCSVAFRQWLQHKKADMSRDCVIRLVLECFREHRASKVTNVPFDFPQLFSNHPVQNKQVDDPIAKKNDPAHVDSEQQDRQDVDKEEPPAPKLRDEVDSFHTDSSDSQAEAVLQSPEESQAPDESGSKASSSQRSRRLQQKIDLDHVDSEQLLLEELQAQDLDLADVPEESHQS